MSVPQDNPAANATSGVNPMEQPLDVGAPRRAREFLNACHSDCSEHNAETVVIDLLRAYDTLAARYAHLVVAITGSVDE